MKKIVFNQFEKLSSTDFNTLQDYLYKDFQDSILYTYFKNLSGCIGTSFFPTLTTATSVTLTAGKGFYYDSTQAGNTPKYRAIDAPLDVVATIAAPHATLGRIDLICVAPLDISTTENRYLKTGGIGPVTQTTVNKSLSSSYQIQVIAGTPDAAPTWPATPAGWNAVARVTVTPAVGATLVTDVRTILSFAVSNAAHVYALSTTLQKQLDQLDLQLVAEQTLITSNTTNIASHTTSIASHTTSIAANAAAITAKTIDSIAPTTTKGDLIIRGTSANVRQPIGSNLQVPVADSAQATGMRWDNVGIPTGTVLQFAGITAPTGFLFCDGSVQLTSSYPALFAALSNVFGGNGSTTFGLPSMQGRTVVGAGTYTDPVSGALTRSLGQTLGAEAHLLTAVQSGLPLHSHTEIYDSSGSGGTGVGLVGAGSTSLPATSHNSTNPTGGTAATSTHNNMQPSLVLNYIIKT